MGRLIGYVNDFPYGEKRKNQFFFLMGSVGQSKKLIKSKSPNFSPTDLIENSQEL